MDSNFQYAIWSVVVSDSRRQHKTGSHLTPRWREGDGFELPVREHRAMTPSHGFADASQGEAALRGAPASHGETAFRGAAGSVRPAAAIRSTHREMRCSAAVQAARYRAARRAAMRSAHCAGRHETDRPRARRALCAERKRPSVEQSAPRQRPADQCRKRHASVGRAARP